jgi:hypothetical protein
MTRPTAAFSTTVLLLAFSALLDAQTQTIINGRGEQRPAPYHASGGGWSATVDHDTARAALTLAERDLKPRGTADYDVVVTNTGSKSVTVPRTLDWGEIDSGASGQEYLIGQVVFELSTKDAFTPITPALNLYSVDGKPSSRLVLEPGDSVRILGTLRLPANGFSPKWRGTAALTAHFCISSVRISSGEGSRHASQNKTMLWCVSADPTYEVHFDPGQ